MLEQIKQAKDKKEIAEIEMNNMPLWKQFVHLKDDTRAVLQKLDKIVQSALFYDVRGEEYWPPMPTYKEEVTQLESRERIFFDYSGGGVTANEKYPDIGNAVGKINALVSFIKANHDILEDTFLQEYNIPLSHKSADFWEDVLHASIVLRDR
ncbi:hypothetical protein [Peribacillus sp. NPDC101480]|uniref:hypothetical protein n=1 Tax=Peribacillus sp. NPDC101480 TaxID=3390620 RepID=UPI003CFE0CA0